MQEKISLAIFYINFKFLYIIFFQELEQSQRLVEVL